jgi:hypothetical protein
MTATGFCDGPGLSPLSSVARSAREMVRRSDQKLTIGTSGTGEGFVAGLGGAVGVAVGEGSGASEGATGAVADGAAESTVVADGVAAAETSATVVAPGVPLLPPTAGPSAAAATTMTRAVRAEAVSKAVRRDIERRRNMIEA